MMEPHAQPLVDVETRTFDPAFGKQGLLDRYFEITARGSTQRQEFIAGVTTFLAQFEAWLDAWWEKRFRPAASIGVNTSALPSSPHVPAI